MESTARRWIITWLIAGCLLVYLMVLLGGITRLTGSGLSITEWNVVMGTFPPNGEQEWQSVFEKYQQSPQFQKVNFDFSLADFKAIFWWEYLHRLVGRIIGLVFIIPFAIFIYKKWLSRKLIINGVIIFSLGGLQGLFGWLMVKSGLVHDPQVSHFRLAIHLLTAFVTFGYIFYVLLDVMFTQDSKLSKSMNLQQYVWLTQAFLFLILLQIIYGAFTAGLHAGKIYNTFPMMGDSWMPESVYAMAKATDNVLINLAGVQFIHRMLAWLLVIVGITLSIQVLRKFDDKLLKLGARLVFTFLIMQFLLGIFTLLFAVPITLGVLHQSGAFLLFASALFLAHRFKHLSV